MLFLRKATSRMVFLLVLVKVAAVQLRVLEGHWCPCTCCMAGAAGPDLRACWPPLGHTQLCGAHFAAGQPGICLCVAIDGPVNLLATSSHLAMQM